MTQVPHLARGWWPVVALRSGPKGWNQAQNPSAFKPGGYHKTAGCVKPSLEEQVMVAMRQGDWARFVTEYRMDQVVSRNHLSDECRSPSTGRYLRKTKPLEN